MTMYLAKADFDALIREDVPYFDLTSFALGIDSQPADIAYFTREDCVVCGSEEVAEVFRRLGITADSVVPSGTAVGAGAVLVSGHGGAGRLHEAWKVGQNLLDHLSGVATATRRMVDAVHAVNPELPVLTTRKMYPGTKALAVKAVMAGGALPHRLGLSETVLVFKQHLDIIGGMDELLRRLPEMKQRCCEKKIIVECETLETAEALCAAGADGIQFDKLTAPEFRAAAEALTARFPHVILLAAGGINAKNAADYAAAKISGIVTTAVYTAPTVDIGVKITPRRERAGS
ncbi:MAG: ModD protein [Oscillospiraceae bacterium]|nr:ModD protein [Oscillospiraceae bacterium]